MPVTALRLARRRAYRKLGTTLVVLLPGKSGKAISRRSLKLALAGLFLFVLTLFLPPVRSRLAKIFKHIESFFVDPTLTSFGARLATTRLTFQTAAPDPESGDAGLFASDRRLDMDILGCKSLIPLTVPTAQHVSCSAGKLSLRHVALNSLSLPEATRVDLFLEDRRLHLRLIPPVQTRSLRAVLAATEHTPRLAPGQWLIEPDNLGIEIALSPLPSRSEESPIHLLENSSIFFESEGASALVGDNNSLLIAKTKNSISLKESRLVVQQLHATRIRSLDVHADTSHDPVINLVVSGQSPRILVYSSYTDLPANEALSRFDSLYAGKTTRSLGAGVAAIAAILGILTIFFAAIQTLYAVLQFHRRTS